MNKRGFTLVELLGVIIILSLLALITTTAVTKIVSDSKEELSDTQIQLIKSAAQAWGSDNILELPTPDTNSTSSCIYITLKDLKNYGLMEDSVINPKTNQEISDDLKIKVTVERKNNNIVTSYKVNPNNSELEGCYAYYKKTICTAVTSKTDPTEIEIGDEYTCEVGPNKKYTFFVLSIEENNINLIMDSNIASDGTSIKSESTINTLKNSGIEYDTAWISTEDYSGNLCDPNDESIKILSGKTNKSEIGVWCSQNYAKTDKGPVTAFKYLQSATSSWTYLPDIQINYEDEGNIYGTINTDGTKTTITQKDGIVTATFNNLKARLPKYEEINNLFIDKTHSLDNFGEDGLTKLPEWVTKYIHNHYLYPCYGCSDEKVWRLGGYWLLSSYPLENLDYAAYDISTQGSYGYSNVLATRKFFDTSTGIRPVISIPLNRIG